MNKSLEGTTVLELGQYISAPYVGQMLADFGANVIKIEPPRGDVARSFDPYCNGMSCYFASYNRNKKFVTLDMKTEDGKKIFGELVAKSDIVLQNFRPGVLEKLGFSFHHLQELNPAIIEVALSGFGQDNPNSQKMALDMTIQAETGFMAVSGFPENPPTKAGPAISDFVSALYTTIGVFAALEYRHRTGKGQFVDVAMFDSLFAILENYPAIYYACGTIPPQPGNGRPFAGPVGTFKTKDGVWIQLSATANNHFEILANLIGCPEMASWENMKTSNLRKQNEAEINSKVAEWVAGLTAEEAVGILKKADLPHGVVASFTDVLQSPQLKYRELLVCPPEGLLGDVPVIGNPVKLSESPVVYERAAMPLGYDNDTVFKDLIGMDDQRYAEMRAAKVI